MNPKLPHKLPHRLPLVAMHATSAIRAYPQAFPLLTKYYLNAERGRA